VITHEPGDLRTDLEVRDVRVQVHPIETLDIQHDEWAVARRYLSEASMAELSPACDTEPAQPADLESAS
jgi:hypothetical protein